MDLWVDAVEFGKLSCRYRNLVAEERLEEASKVMLTIKKLVIFNAERLTRAFRTTLTTRNSGIERGVGVPLVGMSMPQIIARGKGLKREHMTTLNIKQEQPLHGVNFLLDYSGSMWFPDPRNTISGLMRIHAQNFLALVYGVYLQKISHGKMMVVFTPFSRTPVHFPMSDVISADWDLFICHKDWSNGLYSRRIERLPKKLQEEFEFDTHLGHDWHCNVHPKEAIESSNAWFANKKLSDFITVLFTDGGMHRVGESHEDRLKFLRQSLLSAAQNRLSFCFLISQQTRSFKKICEEIGFKHTITDNKVQYNESFTYLTHLVNKTRGK